MSLTEQEILRYARHIILPEVGGRGQRKLKAASVLVAGAGAAGSAAALYLAAAGIGRVSVWDPSILSPQDLEGAIAHAGERVGTPRARSAAAALRAIHPEAEVLVLDREADVEGAVPEHSVVVASLGDWEALNRAALHAGTPLVLTAAHGAGGAATAMRRGEPCLACLGPERSALLGLYPEGGAPVLAAAAGVIGVVGATEAVKLILSIGAPIFGRVLAYDGWNATFREEPFERRPDCPACGQFQG